MAKLCIDLCAFSDQQCFGLSSGLQNKATLAVSKLKLSPGEAGALQQQQSTVAGELQHSNKGSAGCC